MSWVDKHKLSSKDLSKLGLREKGKLHEESKYLLVTEKTLSDIIVGLKNLFEGAAASVLYHVFKRAAERKTRSLMGDMRKHLGIHESSDLNRKDLKIVLREVVKQLVNEGYCREVRHEVNHAEGRVLIHVKDPISLRLKGLVEESGVNLTEDELTAIERGLIAGVLSSTLGEEIDLKKAVIYGKGNALTIILPSDVYSKIFMQ